MICFMKEEMILQNILTARGKHHKVSEKQKSDGGTSGYL